MFTAKTRVALKGNKVPFKRGTTVNDPEKDLVIVEWDDGNVNKLDVRKLILESEAAETERKVVEGIALAKKKAAEEKAAKEAKEALLEAEFQLVKQKISAKLRDAGVAFQEAIDLAAQHNKSITGYDFDSDLGPLYSAMENAGIMLTKRW